MKLILILVPLLLLSYITEWSLRRALKTERKSVWGFRPVNKVHLYTALLLVGIYALASIILKWTELAILQAVTPACFFILYVFRIYMEWKHDPARRNTS
ncbi:DUF4181 domain-containing protein [Neobacillus mesonae]|uniref:DUF4181 domain-containing protein n=1 Tax=Neobacillus mesonae TaxID=1193713 RepID=UPI00399D28BA